MDKAFDPILNEEELAQWLDISRPTLQRQRSDGSLPAVRPTQRASYRIP